MKNLILSLALLTPLLVCAAAKKPTLHSLDRMQNDDRQYLHDNWEQYRQLYWESEIYDVVNRVIPPHIKGPDRVSLIDKLLRTFIADRAHMIGRIIAIGVLDHNELGLLNYQYCSDIRFASEKLQDLTEEFYKLLPESCWMKLDVSKCAALTEQSKNRLKTAWLAAKRDIKNLILPQVVAPASTAASTAATAVGTKDSKTDK